MLEAGLRESDSREKGGVQSSLCMLGITKIKAHDPLTTLTPAPALWLWSLSSDLLPLLLHFSSKDISYKTRCTPVISLPWPKSLSQPPRFSNDKLLPPAVRPQPTMLDKPTLVPTGLIPGQSLHPESFPSSI